MAEAAPVAGLLFELTFDARDATPDLPGVGPVRGRVVGPAPGGPAPARGFVGELEVPRELQGFRVLVDTRYQEEPLEDALAGRPVTVNALIESAEGRAVAGGIATLVFERGRP